MSELPDIGTGGETRVVPCGKCGATSPSATYLGTVTGSQHPEWYKVVDALEGRAVIFDGLGVRVTHLLDEMDEWIARAGDAERRLEDADAKLTAVRVALTESGVPEVDPYPEEDVSDHEKSLRAGGRVIDAVARIERLAARLAAAGDVVKMARQLVSYEWEARLDNSKVSDDAKHDARELSYAVYEYDRTAKS